MPKSGLIKSAWARRFLLAFVCCLTIASGVDRCLAKSIFDDDWVSPSSRKPVPAPPAPTTAPDPTATRPTPLPKPITDPPTTTPTPVAAQPPPNAPAPTPAISRRPIPATADQRRSRQLFKEVFAKELADATPPGHRALAVKLLAEAGKAKDVPVDQFVLLTSAIEAAKLGSDLAPCVAAADELGKAFQVDALSVKVDSTFNMPLQATTPAIIAENCRNGLLLVSKLLAADDFETANKLLGVLRPTAIEPDLRDEVVRRVKDFDAPGMTPDELTADLAKLESSPEDPAANLALGQHLCFVQGNWTRGLPMLIKGGDAELKTLAILDLAAPTIPLKRAALGNAWWDAAAKRDGLFKAGMRTRGYTWLSKAISRLTGLQKLAAIHRMAESPFLDAQVGKIAQIDTRGGKVTQLAFGPDGHSALVASEDGAIRQWDLFSNDMVREFLGHTGLPNHLSVGGTGKMMISCGTSDQTVRVWDLVSGKELHKYVLGSDANMAAISPDGAKILFAGNLAGPFIAPTTTFREAKVEHGEGNYAGVWSPSGRYFAIGGYGRIVHVYDARTQKEVTKITQADQVYSVAFTADDKRVLTGDPGNHLRVFDLRTGRLLLEMTPTHNRSLEVTPDGRYAMAPGGETKLFFWDLTTGERSSRFEGEQGSSISAVVISRDGKFALSGDDEGIIRLWRLP